MWINKPVKLPLQINTSFTKSKKVFEDNFGHPMKDIFSLMGIICNCYDRQFGICEKEDWNF